MQPDAHPDGSTEAESRAPAAIRAQDLTKHYGDVEALVGLDLEVHRGEVFGFLGPNGSGKSTTIRTLLDEIRPTRGSATILGMDTHRQSVEIRRHIGYVPGDLAMYPNLTGRDTLRFFANLRGGVDWGHVEQLAERLEADLSRKVGNLSTGNRQKVALVQAFMNRPDLLLLDEPNSGLDPLMQREFQNMMREVVADGRTVFLSSHTLSEVERVADRVGIIRHGELVAVEGVASLRSKAIRRIELRFEGPVDSAPFEALAGAREVAATDGHLVLSFDGDMAALLETATATGGLRDVATHEADLEEIFLAYYHDEQVV